MSFAAAPQAPASDAEPSRADRMRVGGRPPEPRHLDTMPPKNSDFFR